MQDWRMSKSSAISSIILIAFALAAWLEAVKLPFGKVSAPGAGFFPAVLAALLLGISLLVFFDALRERTRRRDDSEPLTWKKILPVLGLLLFFALLLETLGYLVITVLFLSFALRAVERQSWTSTAFVSLIASVGSYMIFKLLGIPLPIGLFQI